ncbi:MAG: hypothetical protein HQL07_10790 [Nitrospirae bacterium]|nr:hypothetical protein [Magnetococcales bacterium]HAT49502.1 hypothetical protein [Alphaproteobacteria bacterium]
MGSLSIVANQQEYKIFDHEAGEILVTGIGSYRNALRIYDRLMMLQEIAAVSQMGLRANPVM